MNKNMVMTLLCLALCAEAEAGEVFRVNHAPAPVSDPAADVSYTAQDVIHAAIQSGETDPLRIASVLEAYFPDAEIRLADILAVLDENGIPHEDERGLVIRSRVADVLESLTDPERLAQALNYDTAGNRVRDYTAAEIQLYLDALGYTATPGPDDAAPPEATDEPIAGTREPEIADTRPRFEFSPDAAGPVALKIVKTVDGGSFIATDENSARMIVALAGIHPTDPSAAYRTLTAYEGQDAYATTHADTPLDEFDRLRGLVFLPDGTSVNDELVRADVARVVLTATDKDWLRYRIPETLHTAKTNKDCNKQTSLLGLLLLGLLL